MDTYDAFYIYLFFLLISSREIFTWTRNNSFFTSQKYFDGCLTETDLVLAEEVDVTRQKAGLSTHDGHIERQLIKRRLDPDHYNKRNKKRQQY